MSCTSSSPLEIPVGGDVTFGFQLKRNGIPIDITDDTVRLYVALGATKANLLVKSTDPGDGIEKTEPELGRIEVSFAPADTDVDAGGLRPRAYVYDIWVETQAGKHHQMCGPTPFVVTEGVGR